MESVLAMISITSVRSGLIFITNRFSCGERAPLSQSGSVRLNSSSVLVEDPLTT